MITLEVLSQNLKFGVHRINNKMSEGKKAWKDTGILYLYFQKKLKQIQRTERQLSGI